MEAELLYAKFPGESNVHAAFQEAIDNALAVYRVSQDMNEYAEAEAALRRSDGDLYGSDDPLGNRG